MSIILITKINNGTGTAQSMGNYDWRSDRATFNVASAEIFPTSVAAPLVAMITVISAGRAQLAAIFRTVQYVNGSVAFVPVVKCIGIEVARDDLVAMRIDFMDANTNVVMVPYNANCIMQLVPA